MISVIVSTNNLRTSGSQVGPRRVKSSCCNRIKASERKGAHCFLPHPKGGAALGISPPLCRNISHDLDARLKILGGILELAIVEE
ncbi:hypothetical protein BHE74_00003041 [Ensete ventricosum]|nr:hypothetical protein GW17_00034556 [Ensete ventricosum]RWW88090.1 hypothetical protein BHE74_00003041 [Ensete ventricosum]RZR78816.1 hypothetical protein BHM03_00004354 [Ensete ventricosum]